MQTEPNKEAKPAPKKEEPKKPETRSELKARLLSIPDHKRTKKDSLRLVDIAKEEESERKHGALVHRITERADKWGRKRITAITLEVTGGVKNIASDETLERAKVLDSYNSKVAAARDLAKQQMTAAQEELTSSLASLKTSYEQEEEQVRGVFRPKYDEASFALRDRSADVTNIVGDFTGLLPSLTMEQLEELHKDGTTQVGDDCVAVPDAASQPATA